MQQRSEETRSHILASAADMFSKHGYDATGVAEICHAAGVSKGAFYHHFPSKQAVFLVLLKKWLDDLQESLAAYPREARSVPGSLVDMAGMMDYIFDAAHGRLSIYLEFWLQASRDPVVWSAAIQPYHQFEAYFASLVEKGIAEGSMRPTDTGQAAHTILSLAIGLLLQGLLDPQSTDWGQAARESLQILMTGLTSNGK